MSLKNKLGEVSKEKLEGIINDLAKGVKKLDSEEFSRKLLEKEMHNYNFLYEKLYGTCFYRKEYLKNIGGNEGK